MLYQIYNTTTHVVNIEPVFHLANLFAEQAKSECDWLVISSVFVASQSSCFFLCLREQIRLVENQLYWNYADINLSRMDHSPIRQTFELGKLIANH